MQPRLVALVLAITLAVGCRFPGDCPVQISTSAVALPTADGGVITLVSAFGFTATGEAGRMRLVRLDARGQAVWGHAVAARYGTLLRLGPDRFAVASATAVEALDDGGNVLWSFTPAAASGSVRYQVVDGGVRILAWAGAVASAQLIAADGTAGPVRVFDWKSTGWAVNPAMIWTRDGGLAVVDGDPDDRYHSLLSRLAADGTLLWQHRVDDNAKQIVETDRGFLVVSPQDVGIHEYHQATLTEVVGDGSAARALLTLQGSSIDGVAALDDELLVLAHTSDGHVSLRALGAADGAVRWQRGYDDVGIGYVRDLAVETDGALFTMFVYPHVYALAVGRDGSVRWSTELDLDDGTRVRSDSGDWIFAGRYGADSCSYHARVIRLDDRGKRGWTTDL